MSNIFAWEAQDIDLKDTIKLKTNCEQSDTMILQFKIYDYDSPVDLTNFNVSFVAKKPSGNIYGQVENIIKSSNSLTITCDSQLTSETGRVVGTIVLTDNNEKRKSSYFIVLNVFGIVNDDDRVVSKNFVDILNRFDEDVAIALSLSDKFKEDIIEAKRIEDDFAIKIPQANTLNTTLNNTINNANTLNTTLNNTIDTGEILDSSLNNHITMGNTVNSNLIANISSGGQTNDELTTIIANAEQIKQDLQNFDTNNIVSNTNIMLDEMYCTQELLTLNHNLNGYPIIKLTYTEYGAGIGGAGNFPAGADSDCNLMQSKAVYTDRNNLKVYVPQNYYIANPSLNKIDNYKYVVTFTNSTRSILIELIEGDVQNQVEEINNNISNIDNKLEDLTYQTATGTATAITLSLPTLINGYSKTFIASANNNGSPTTINGKHLYKPNTTTSPNIISGKAYTIWYNSVGDCFFIKASAEGDADVSHVLAGKKFSNDNDTELVGTLDLSNLVSENLRSGVTINGVSGKSSVVDTADAVLDPQYLLTGQSGYDDGDKKTGTMIDRGVYSNQCTSSTVLDNKLFFRFPIGFYHGGNYDSNGGVAETYSPFSDVANSIGLTSDKIVAGNTILGLNGTATGSREASGTLTQNVSSQTITLGNRPKVVFIYNYLLESSSENTHESKYSIVTDYWKMSFTDNHSGDYGSMDVTYITLTDTGFIFNVSLNSNDGESGTWKAYY